ncbi:GTPase IMAP family member 8-like [Halichoeres trimaculatus]|uniref:GTPase IMAP family member 8-like n=1 Tax=Halichoeres trimaculatus TaxID=147232 RepID=UPI003D9E0A78
MDASIKTVVFLGTTGSGKSSLGNTIFGEDVFKVNHTSKFIRSECQKETRSVKGRTITLMDTPGLFVTDTPEEDEISRSITNYAPGPHAFLIVLKVEKFTEHERAVVTKIKKSFSEEAFKYAAVVFTHGDQLEEGQTIKDFVSKEENLRDLVEKCGGGCHVIDNKYWKKKQDEYRDNEFQVENLLQTIDQMIKDKNNGCCTNEMLQDMEINSQSSGSTAKEMGSKKSRGSVQNNGNRKKRSKRKTRFSQSTQGNEETLSVSSEAAVEQGETTHHPPPIEPQASTSTGDRPCGKQLRERPHESATLDALQMRSLEKDMEYKELEMEFNISRDNLYFSLSESDRRVAIVGKTGAGKSSTANTIFGEKLFKDVSSAGSGTEKCQAATRLVCGKKYTLIDTPGFFDTRMPEEVMKDEIVRCVTESAPGIHAFLILLKVEKYTEHEQAVITKINEYFSEEAFRYSTLVFTHGDQLQEGQGIEDFIRDNESLRGLLRMCGGRCHVIDNKYWKDKPPGEYRSNKFQVEQLLQTIDRMIRDNNNRCYTNKMLQEAEEEIQQEMETIRQSSGSMPEEEVRKKAKKSVWRKLLPKFIGVAFASLNVGLHMMSNNGLYFSLSAANRRVVILGTTGSGKSSLGNTIFGEDVFKVNHTYKFERSECQEETRSVNGKTITLMDTPGFFDTDTPEQVEILRSITDYAPGPHAFLIVLKVEKFTDHERAVVTKIEKSFSEKVFKYAAVVFTHGDQLEEGQRIEDFIRDNESLRDLVRKCSGRCHVIDNKHWKENPPGEYRSNKFQVGQLLQTIDRMIKKNNDDYTNKVLQVEEENKRVMKTNQWSPGHLVQTELLPAPTAAPAGMLVGAFLDVKIMVGGTFRNQSTKA